MTGMIRFSELAAGQTIPELTAAIDRLSLVRFAGAADDYVAQHWDHTTGARCRTPKAYPWQSAQAECPCDGPPADKHERSVREIEQAKIAKRNDKKWDHFSAAEQERKVRPAPR